MMFMKPLLYILGLSDIGLIPYLLLTNPYAQLGWGLSLAHAVLSVLIGLVSRQTLPIAYQSPKWQVVGFLTFFSFFIPLGGAMGILFLVELAIRSGQKTAPMAIYQVGEPRPSYQTSTEQSSSLHGDPLAQFMVESVQAPTRLQALATLQNLNASNMSDVLKSALLDEADEIRLYAFGILNQREKTISARINQDLALYHQSQDPKHQAEYARQIAYAYWDLVYKNLVDGDVWHHAIGQAKDFAHTALNLEEHDAGMWTLLGQIYLRQGNWDQAHDSFAKGLSNGIPESRVVPYMAEIAFHQKAFVEATRLFSETEVLEDIPALQPVVAYWTQAAPITTISKARRGGPVHV